MQQDGPEKGSAVHIPNATPLAAASIDWMSVLARADAHCMFKADAYEQAVNEAQAAAGDPAAQAVAWREAATIAVELIAAQARAHELHAEVWVDDEEAVQ